MEKEKQLILSIDRYKEILQNNKIVVAVSGGIDSLSLLLITNEWAKNNNSIIIGLTVNHKLRKEAEEEALYVNNLCKKLGIKHYILNWEGEKPYTNIEAIARENRYKLIKEFCDKNNIKYVLVAHHLQDQAETFFIRLFRGSGIDGLSSMESVTNLFGINIIRPFLDIKKEDLKEYLVNKNIKWIEDPSNSDEKYLRNKIRNFLNSFENKEEILKRINSAVEKINITKKIIDDEIIKIEKKAVTFSLFGSCSINKNILLKQNEEIILKILAKIAMKISGNIYKPRLEKLKRLLKNIIEDDNLKYTFYGCIFEKFDENLIMVYREYNSIDKDEKLMYNKEVVWDNRFKIILKKNEENLIVTHIKEGEFVGILEKIRKENFKKYKEMKEIKGIEKKIFYTLPIVKRNDEYLIEYSDIEINNFFN